MLHRCTSQWGLHPCTSQWELHPCTSQWVLHRCTSQWVLQPCTNQWVLYPCTSQWVLYPCTRQWVLTPRIDPCLVQGQHAWRTHHGSGRRNQLEEARETDPWERISRRMVVTSTQPPVPLVLRPRCSRSSGSRVVGKGLHRQNIEVDKRAPCA